MADSIIQLNDNKAGMEGLDKVKINAIIEENSKGSRFYENEMRKDKILMQQINEKLSVINSLSHDDIKKGEKAADSIIMKFLEHRCLNQIIVHIDMDAFYAAVEMRDDPKLRHQPMAVGSSSMLSTSNYLARRFGVRAAMPGFIAKKLCPQLVIVPTDFARYASVSRDIRSVFVKYDPDFACMSLDEAYLNLTHHMTNRDQLSEQERTVICKHVCKCRKRRHPDELVSETCPESEGIDKELAVCDMCGLLFLPGRRVFGCSLEDAVREIRFKVFAETKLTCSAGVGPNTLTSKIASDKNKPNGQFIVNSTSDDIALFLRNLPIRKIPGIGKVSERKLMAYGVLVCSDLYRRRGVLYHVCTPAAFSYYLRIALGEGDSIIETDGEKKSRSVERTFQEISDPCELLDKCQELSMSLADDLKEEHIKGKTVTLKMKLSNFETRTRAQTMTDVTNDFQRIFTCAKEIMNNEIAQMTPEPLRLRLLGVRMSSLVPEEMCPTIRQWTIQQAFSAASSSSTPDKRKTADSGALPNVPSTSQPKSSGNIETKHTSEIKTHTLNNNSDSECPSSSPVFHSFCAQDDDSSSSSSSGENSQASSSCSSRSPCPSNLPAALTVDCPGNLSAPAVDCPGNLPATQTVDCPVCDRELPQDQMNQHLDACLSRRAIQEAIREVNETLVANTTNVSRTKCELSQASSSKSPHSVSNKKTSKQSTKTPTRPLNKNGPMDKFLNLSKT